MRAHQRSTAYFLGALLVESRVLGRSISFINGIKSNKVETLTAFPSRTCSFPVTAFTLSGSSKVKKAKPLERPSGSRMIVQASTLNACQYHPPSTALINSSSRNEITLPNCEKYVLRPSAHSKNNIGRNSQQTNVNCHCVKCIPSVVSQLRPPINILLSEVTTVREGRIHR